MAVALTYRFPFIIIVIFDDRSEIETDHQPQYEILFSFFFWETGIVKRCSVQTPKEGIPYHPGSVIYGDSFRVHILVEAEQSRSALDLWRS